MKLKVIVHEAEEGGYWAEVPSIPGCATRGETFEELLQNIYEAVDGCLSIDVSPAQVTERDRILEIAVWSLYPVKNLPKGVSGFCYSAIGMLNLDWSAKNASAAESGRYMYLDLTIYLAAVPDLYNINGCSLVVNWIDDSKVALADSITLLTGKLFDPIRAGIIGKCVNSIYHLPEGFLGDAIEFLDCSGFDRNVISFHEP
jgi:predicted RNase H-like HicB family nuclease